MTLVLHRIDDPRDALSKARRKPLENFARDAGIAEIAPGMPAELMKRIIRLKGYIERFKEWAARNQIVNQPLGGAKPQPADAPVADNAVTADDDLMRQWMVQHKTNEEAKQEHEPEQIVSVAKMSITQLRQECKKRKIPMKRTDNMNILREKLSVQDAS